MTGLQPLQGLAVISHIGIGKARLIVVGSGDMEADLVLLCLRQLVRIACEGLRDGQISEYLLILICQVDLDRLSGFQFFSIRSDRSILLFKSFDCLVGLGDRIAAWLYIVEFHFEQEAVLGISCHFVAFDLRKVSKFEFGRTFFPGNLTILSDMEISTGRLILDGESEFSFGFFLRYTAGHGLGEGKLACGRRIIIRKINGCGLL